jgi:hypothetical protein
MSYLVWLVATRTAKLLPHLWTRPHDIIYVPAFILFGYYFAIMKVYALLTLHEVSIPTLVITPGTLLKYAADWLGYSCWRRRPVSSCGSCCRGRKVCRSQETTT